MRIFKNKWFVKFAKKEKIDDQKLIQAIHEIETGNVDADYGGGVIKQRIGRTNEGKSGGYRTIIVFRKGDKAFFVFGYAKSTTDNIDSKDVREFKDLAKLFLSLTDEDLFILMEENEIEELIR